MPPPDFAVDGTVFVVSLYDGVFKSTDGGLTWQPAQAGLPHDAPRRIALSPNYAQDATVFLSTHSWLWRSQDGGANWDWYYPPRTGFETPPAYGDFFCMELTCDSCLYVGYDGGGEIYASRSAYHADGYVQNNTGWA